jgi:hypothetical protein
VIAAIVDSRGSDTQLSDIVLPPAINVSSLSHGTRKIGSGRNGDDASQRCDRRMRKRTDNQCKKHNKNGARCIHDFQSVERVADGASRASKVSDIGILEE